MNLSEFLIQPETLFSLAMFLVMAVLMILVMGNLLVCKKWAEKCYQELDQQSSLLKSQIEHLESLDIEMQHFSQKMRLLEKKEHENSMEDLPEEEEINS